MNKYVKIAIAAGVLVAPVQAHAVTGNVIFNADVQNTCAIVVNDAGTLTTNVGQTQLSSENAGGAAGTATITTTSAAFKASVANPTAFDSAPAGGGTSTSFASKFSGSGATTIASTLASAPAVSLNTGVTNVSVHLAATKSTGSFPTGLYAATVVLTCQ